MKHRIIIFFATVAAPCILAFVIGHAGDLPVFKLPYAHGESFVVTQGYHSPPTHIKKDDRALDFTQNGCDAYAKPVVASSGGTVLLAQESGYNGGYGSQILVDHGGALISRYAHMIAGSFQVRVGDRIAAGAALGEVGDTGLVAGNACVEHPGTHLHFAVYQKENDGSYAAVDPEPLSGYRNIIEGSWYRSDNELAQADGGTSSALAMMPLLSSPDASTLASPGGVSTVDGSETGDVLGVSTINNSSAVVASPTVSVGNVSAMNTTTIVSVSSSPQAFSGTSTAVSSSINSSSIIIVSNPVGGVTASPGSGGGSSILVPLSTQDTSSTPTSMSDTATSSSSGDTSATSTVPGSDPASSSTATSTPSSTPITQPPNSTSSDEFLVVQSSTDVSGLPSWYDDTWYQLGTGFYGTIRSLMLNGSVTPTPYFASHLSLDEFLDAGYSRWNKSWDISDDAPFTATSTFVTIDDLDIPLQPNKYYRLDASNDYQNRSIVLRGTDATGTAMSNGYVFNVGRVENHYQFYPYLAWKFVPNYPALLPPDEPPGLAVSFDNVNVGLNISWHATTDSDTTSSLLTYEYAVTTSSAAVESDWHSVGAALSAYVLVSYPNVYEVAVRARDDLGNVSVPDGVTWTFPSGYYVLPSQLDHSGGASVNPGLVHLDHPVTLTGMSLWAEYWRYGMFCCSLSYISWYADQNGAPGDLLGTTNVSYAPTPPDEVWYDFAQPLILPAGDYWFQIADAPRSNGTVFYGDGKNFYYRLRVSAYGAATSSPPIMQY